MTQAGYTLHGLCYSDGRLYVVERRDESDRYNVNLTVHSVQSDSGHITRLDTLTGLGGGVTVLEINGPPTAARKFFLGKL